MQSQQRSDDTWLTHVPVYECYLCGGKYDSELSKDIHMGNCRAADGPNSLDSSLDDPFRAFLRPNNPLFGITSPNHQPSDFSTPVGSRIEATQMPVHPYIPPDYTEEYAPDGDMRKRIQYPPKPKPVLTGRDPAQIAPYVLEGPRNPLFHNSNIQTGMYNLRPQLPSSAPFQQASTPYGYSRTSQTHYTPRAPPPLPPTDSGHQLPFQEAHAPVTRHPSDPRYKDVIAPPSYGTRYNEVTNVPMNHDKITRSSVRESYQSEAQTRHEASTHLPARVNPRDSTRGNKFEVKLLWEKQQPTLETNLEYLDVKDTDPTITLRWDYRKEMFIGLARLSPGEHTGSLAIPDTDAVVYEVHSFNISQFSVAEQEIKLELVEVAPQYKSKSEPIKRPVYSEIDLVRKHQSSTSRREDFPQYTSERRETLPSQSSREERRRTLSGTESHIINFQPVREEKTRVEVKALSTPLELSAPLPIERPAIPPKYKEELPKYQTDLNNQTFKPFKIVREDKTTGLAGTEVSVHPLVFNSTLPRHEDRLSNTFVTPIQEHPLPPPRSKPTLTTDNSPEDLAQKRQIDALIAKLKSELASVKQEREEVETRLGGEVNKWKNNHENLYQHKLTADKDIDAKNRELEHVKRELSSSIKHVEDKSADILKFKESLRDLEETNSALLREKEAGKKEESRTRLYQEEKKDKEVEGRFQNLLEESQRKIQNLQAERDSYKIAAYKYRAEREKIKISLEEEKTANKTLKADYEQKFADALYQINTLTNKLKQSEEQIRIVLDENNKLKDISRNKLTSFRTNNNNNNTEGVSERDMSEISVTSSLNLKSVKVPYNEHGSISLGSIEPDINYQLEKKPSISVNKPIIHVPKSEDTEYFSYLAPNPEPAPPVLRNYKKQSSVKSRIKLLEEKHVPEAPVASPRYFKSVSAGRIEGLESYRPELFTSFITKQIPVQYKSSTVKTTKLSYFQRPESHLHKQVLVKIKDVYKLGTLEVVFSRKFSFPNKTRILAGIKLQEPAGNSNGTFDAICYFDSEPNHAVFTSVEEVFINIL